MNSLRLRRACVACLLVCACWLLSCVVGGASASVPAGGPNVTALLGQSRVASSLIGITSVTTATFLARTTELYRILRPEIEIEVTQVDSTATVTAIQTAQQLMQQGAGDFAFLSFQPTAADRANAPDLEYFPLWASPFSAVFNLPGVSQLILDLSILSRIYTGNVTLWNDPMIVALNPAASLPNQAIEVVLQESALVVIQEFTRACSGIDPWFEQLIGFTAFPVWPTARYAKFATASGIAGPVSYVVVHPYSLTLALTSFANKLDATSAQMVNPAGAVVQPTLEATSTAFSELCVRAARNETGGISYSWSGVLTQAPGEDSWPLVVFTGLTIPRTFSRQSCMARSELVKFLRWMLNADATRTGLGTSELVALLTPEVDAQLGVTEFLKGLACGWSTLATNDVQPLMAVGPQLVGSATNARELLVGYYSTRVRTDHLQVESIAGDEITALLQTMQPDRLAGQADFSWIWPATILSFPSASALTPIIASGNAFLASLAFYGLVIRHSLNATLLEAALLPATASTTAAGPPQQAKPLVLDLETLGELFAGGIGHWTDPRLVSLNPGLATAFAEVADDRITLILCGDGAQTSYDTVLSNHMIILLSGTAAFKRLAAASPTTLLMPANWVATRAAATALGSSGPLVITVSNEQQLGDALSAVPNAIGYVLSEATTLPSAPSAMNWFDLLRTVDSAAPVRVSPSPTSIRACPLAGTEMWSLESLSSTELQATGSWDLTAVLQSTAAGTATGCWPLTFQLGVVAPIDFQMDIEGTAQAAGKKDAAALCQRADHISSTLQWLLSTDHPAWSRSGAVSAASVPALLLAMQKTMRKLECGGSYLLWTPAVVWSLSSSLVQMGYALGAISLFASLSALGTLVLFRARTMMRSAGFVFQGFAVSGLTLLSVALLLLASPPSQGTCSSLAWTLVIGFSMAFIGPALRLGHSWVHMQRARTKQLKRLKLETLSRAGARALGMLCLALDVAVLAAAQSRGGLLRPLSTVRLEGAQEHIYTSCSLSVDGGVFPHALILLAVHAIALVSCSLFGFVARRAVSAFNEIEHLCRVTWNTTLCMGILAAIMAVTDAQGDAALALEMALLAWVLLVGCACIFGVKQWSLAREYLEHRRDAQVTSKRSANSHGGANSSFGSLASGTNAAKMGASEVASLLAQPLLDGVALATLERYISMLERHLAAARDRRVRELGQPDKAPVAGSAAYMVDDDDDGAQAQPMVAAPQPRPAFKTQGSSVGRSQGTPSGRDNPSQQSPVPRPAPSRIAIRSAALAAEGLGTSPIASAGRQPLRIRTPAQR